MNYQFPHNFHIYYIHKHYILLFRNNNCLENIVGKAIYNSNEKDKMLKNKYEKSLRKMLKKKLFQESCK